MAKFSLLLLALALPCFLFSQDKSYAEYIVKTLSDSAMHGRGYVNDGDKKSAEFIMKEFRHAGLQPMAHTYFQSFPMTVNSFPDTISVEIDGSLLEPGKDFVVMSYSPSVHNSFDLVYLAGDSLLSENQNIQIADKSLSGKVLVTDANPGDLKESSLFDASGVVFLTRDKVWWHVSNGREVKDFFGLKIREGKINEQSKEISVAINNRFDENHITQNVIGYLDGMSEPDSFAVFTAHYDHLGRMGEEIYFPGANDNASGVAMLLDLAHFYGKPENRPDFSMVFIAFAAEEAGLLGSAFFTANPTLPLSNIKFLVNLDMVGSGSEGIKVVNGSVFENRFQQLVDLNEKNKLLTKVSKRGEAANSDHYPFYAAGVPCFFIYTLGKESPEYHTVEDTPQNVPFTEYNDLFTLLTLFVEKL